MSKKIGTFKPKTGRFGASSETEKQAILLSRNADNTNKSTVGAVNMLNEYLAEKGLPDLDHTLDIELPSVLENFYVNARTKKTGELYHTQSLKCIRAGLNRYFQEKRQINIISDSKFLQANLMFKGMQVKAKKEGKGVRHSTPTISDEDMKTLAFYFKIDHVEKPSPRVLQKNVIFNIIYYLCRRGQENLYIMTKDWFDIVTTPQGDRYICQVKDELDKNHRENDTTFTNQGRIYAVPGNTNKYLMI